MFFSFVLDERTKKVILVFCALFILLLLLFGAIYAALAKYMEKQSRKVDQYMYDLCLYRIVNSPKEFRKAVIYYERRSLFNQSKWGIRCLILFTGLLFLIGYLFYDQQYGLLFRQAFTLFPHVSYQTVGQVNETLKQIEGAALIPGPSWMPISVLPTITSKHPDFGDTSLYISTIYYIIILFCFFKIFLSVLTFIARLRRGKKMSGEVFQKKLEQLNIADALTKQYNNENSISYVEEIHS